MAKKMSPVSKTIKAKSTPAKGVKTKGSSTKKDMGKPSSKKPIQKTAAIPPSAVEEQLAQRNAELAILNSISQAMAQRLDMDGIIRIVGDKVRDIFSAEVTEILLLDESTNMIHSRYSYYRGYQHFEPIPFGEGLTSTIIRTRTPNEHHTYEEAVAKGALFQTEEDKTESYIGVPIVTGDKAFGVISVQSYKQYAFDENHMRLLSTLAANMGVALENARLFDETQRLLKEMEERNAELVIINSVQEALASKLEMQAIYNLIGDKVTEIFNTQVTMISLTNSVAKEVDHRYIIERGQRIYYNGHLPMDKFRQRVVDTRQPWLINENYQQVADEIGEETVLGGEEPKSLLFVPMIVGSDVTGVVSLQNLDHENAFSESDVRLLQTLANSMSVALENARLFDETQRLFKAKQERVAELQIINSIQQGLAAELDFQAIVDLVGDKLCEVFNTPDLSIRWYDEKTNLIHYLYSYEHGNRLNINPEPPGDRPIWQKITQSRRPVVWNTSDEGNAISPPLPGTDDSKSGIYIPIIISDRVLGLIGTENYERENAYGESELRLLTTIAASLGTALENARLFDETQRLLKETEQRAAELAFINSVQEGLVARMDIQGIYDLVGDKIHDISDAQVVVISLYNATDNMVHHPYTIERGERLTIPSGPLIGFRKHVIETRQYLLINENLGEEAVRYGNPLAIQGEVPRSVLFVPMMVGDEAKGVISLQNLDREHAFRDSDVRLLQTLANSMSIALESARLFDETQRLLKETEERNVELAVINSIQQGLAAELNFQAVVDLVGDKLREVLQFPDIGIRWYDEKTNLFHYLYEYEHNERLVIPTESPSPDGQFTRILETHQPLIWGTTEEGDAISPSIPGTDESKSGVSVPIINNDRVIGNIIIENYERENAYGESELRLLTTIAASLGTALENARLFDETQRLLKETKQRNAELAAISKVSQALVAETELGGMIQLIGSQIREIFDADIVYVALLDPQTNLIYFPYQVGESFDTLKINEGMTGKIIQSGEPLLINKDVMERVREIGAQNIGREVLSYLGVPIKAGRETIGVISVQSTTQEGLFDDDSLRLLTTIASNAGAAIHTARLHSETQRLFKDAEEARATAEQANKAKSAFLANMSHELRTPLNAIIGFTRIVRRKAEGALPEKQIQNLDKVLSSSDHLLSLINTVLDIAKIEAGRMDVIPANFNAGALVDQCINLAAPLLKPNVNLEKQLDGSIGIIYSDQDKIKQIVLNLLSNAAKFTQEGRVLLAVQKLDAETLSISVSDSGIGISEEALGRVFEEFQQADTSTTRQYGGTGLGLAISRNLARLLGGDLTATSQLGLGSTFTLTLPIQYGKKPASQADDRPALVKENVQPSKSDSAKHRVLVIDDDPDAIYLLQESLDANEFEVIGARNGQDGLQIAREQKPDAILLDILMPEIDGWQVLNDLKANPSTAGIPVTLLTIVDNKALGFRLGAAAYLLKPLDPALVLDTLRHVIGEKESGHNRKVLVVDDDPNIAEMLRQTLPASDFELDSAVDGEAGLLAVEARHPDVILLDLLMPKLDGFGVIEKLRANPELQNVPIIVISAKELTKAESRKLNKRVAFVMKKQGLDGNTLIQEINNIVKK